MSKGSNFWGTARGKLGNMVISSVKGQQVERKYQPQVANPKTFAQMRQRAVFALAVKFFKHSQQNLFKFAFEDKTQKESDYNAFMRHNVRYFTPINKVACDNPTLPALGFWTDLQLSAGSLTKAQGQRFDATDTKNPSFGFTVGAVHEDVSQTKYTWGEVSQALIKKYDLAEGDIITFVVVDPHMNANRFDAQIIGGEEAELNATPAKWKIEQMEITTSSTEDVSANMIGNDIFALTNIADDYVANYLLFGAVIFSRNIKGRPLMVSTSTFACSDGGNYESDLVQEGSYRERNVLLSWGANPEAILKGSLL